MSRRVQTAGDVTVRDPSEVVGVVRDGLMYAPVRTANARVALNDLPIRDLSTFTFIDMGSGKGRVLFLASEYPFKRIIGVEYSTALHHIAQQNIASHRPWKQRCQAIELVHRDAAVFEFPEENLVLYMFNPFGPQVLKPVLEHLRQSLIRCPRRVFVVLLWPENSKYVAEMDCMRLYRQTRRYHIYEAIDQKPTPPPRIELRSRTFSGSPRRTPLSRSASGSLAQSPQQEMGAD